MHFGDIIFKLTTTTLVVSSVALTANLSFLTYDSILKGRELKAKYEDLQEQGLIPKDQEVAKEYLKTLSPEQRQILVQRSRV